MRPSHLRPTGPTLAQRTLAALMQAVILAFWLGFGMMAIAFIASYVTPAPLQPVIDDIAIAGSMVALAATGVYFSVEVLAGILKR